MERKKTNFPNYLVSLISFTVVWLIMELICSVVYKKLPNYYNNGKRIVDLNLGSVPDASASIIPHPYMLYANNPNYTDGDGIQQHNSLGYRGEEFPYVKGPNTIRILALGGSTTYGYLNKDPKSTWPAVLQQTLQQHTSKKVEVINGGIKYGTSAELLSSFVFRHRHLDPDIVIFHEGGNDAMPVLFPDYNPEYTHFRGHGVGTKLRSGESFLLHSNVFKVFYAFWLSSAETVYQAQPYPLDELDRDEASKRVDDDRNYTGFKRNVDLLIRLAKMDSAKVVLFGFVLAREENLTRNRPDQIGLEKTIIRCVDKNRGIMETLAQQHQSLYVEAAQDLFKDEWFLDNCHLSPEGDAAKAKFMAGYLIPMLSEVKNSPITVGSSL